MTVNRWRTPFIGDEVRYRLYLVRQFLRRVFGLDAYVYDPGLDEQALREFAPLIEALSGSLLPSGAFGPCPLHPGHVSTPLGARCCYDPVLHVEDLSPVMKCVTFDESAIKLRKAYFPKLHKCAVCGFDPDLPEES